MAQFTLFSQLPLELQDQIWLMAVPGRPRKAHHVELKFSDRPSEVLLQRAARLDLDAQMPTRYVSVLSALLFTCYRSSAVATGVYRRHTQLAATQAAIIRGFSKPIDASRDLVVLESGWQRIPRMVTDFSQLNNWLPRLKHIDSSRPLRFVGIQWSDPSNHDLNNLIWGQNPSFPHGDLFTLQWYRISTFQNIWSGLEAFYIIVDPINTHRRRLPWSLLGHLERCPKRRQLSTKSRLRQFMDESRSEVKARKPRTFTHGHRRYFEVPLDQVVQSERICEAVEFLCMSRHFHRFVGPSGAKTEGGKIEAEDGPEEARKLPRCMFLSWREVD